MRAKTMIKSQTPAQKGFRDFVTFKRFLYRFRTSGQSQSSGHSKSVVPKTATPQLSHKAKFIRRRMKKPLKRQKSELPGLWRDENRDEYANTLKWS